MDTSAEHSEETRDTIDEETLESEDLVGSAQEQLAELQLLARADLSSPASSFTIPSPEIAATIDQDEEIEACDKYRAAPGGLSSFTAILAASRKMATTATDSTPVNAMPSSNPRLESAVPVLPLDQSCQQLKVEIPGRCSSPKSSTLPILNEGTEGEEEEDEPGSEEIPETVSVVTAPTLADKLSSSRVETIPGRQDQEPAEPDIDDDEFVEMLDHLSRGETEFLALTADDIAVKKLERVRAALRRSLSSTPEMPYVRALVSVDMLWLLLERLGMQPVRDAVHRAIRQIGERDETADPAALLTSSNIAAVVLVARRELTPDNGFVSSPLPRRTNAHISSQHHVRRTSNTSPRCSSSPSSSVSSSPRCGTPRSPAADRRSILAKEGVHVLMQEKLVSFDYRGQANAIPAFRVRGVSASTTESAAKRRQRGLQYANDHIAHRTVYM